MMTKGIVDIIADEWEPFVGSDVARERARNAATLLHGRALTRGTSLRTREILMHSLVQATLPHYGGVKLNDSTMVDAVNAAAQALEDAARQEMP
jgi:hypothetical protein